MQNLHLCYQVSKSRILDMVTHHTIPTGAAKQLIHFNQLQSTKALLEIRKPHHQIANPFPLHIIPLLFIHIPRNKYK